MVLVCKEYQEQPQVLRGIGPQLDLITRHGQHNHLDQFSGGQFNNDDFTGTAGDDEHGNLLLPGCGATDSSGLGGVCCDSNGCVP